MRIHLYSHSFPPSVGGMERLMELLAREFVRLGHAVTVSTESKGKAELPFEVLRAPGFWSAFSKARESEVVLSAPLSIRRLPSFLLAGRRVVVAHPILYPAKGHRLAVLLKRLAERFVTGIVPSQFMAKHFPGTLVIGNPYDAETFVRPKHASARHGVLFVGRLIPEKGCEDLVRAFASVATSETLTIVGNGPQREALVELTEELGLAARSEFLGELTGAALAAVMQQRRVMVVPTTCEEAFGIVALEGLACGCRMIVAESGGLTEAVGPYALTFQIGDVTGLTERIERALISNDTPPNQCDVDAHLEQFKPERVAQKYLAVLQG